jgi:multidrug efflux pump subunit AcrA (membrane-fusion protein)
VYPSEGTLPLAGELRPWQQVELRARLPAYVRERRVDVGDRVAERDLLVALSAPDRVAERAWGAGHRGPRVQALYTM